jgi:hypothetical protein
MAVDATGVAHEKNRIPIVSSRLGQPTNMLPDVVPASDLDQFYRARWISWDE